MTDWHEVGRALGWIGGVLYLGTIVEQKLRAWWAQRQMERWLADNPQPAPSDYPALPDDYRPPRVHVVNCTLCGENTSLSHVCQHPDAPEMPIRVPIRRLPRPPD